MAVYSAELIETADTVVHDIATAPVDEWHAVRVVLLASRLYEALKAERRTQGCVGDMRVMLDHAIARCRRAACGPANLFAREIVAIASALRTPSGFPDSERPPRGTRRPALRIIEGGLASPLLGSMPVKAGRPAI